MDEFMDEIIEDEIIEEVIETTPMEVINEQIREEVKKTNDKKDSKGKKNKKDTASSEVAVTTNTKESKRVKTDGTAFHHTEELRSLYSEPISVKVNGNVLFNLNDNSVTDEVIRTTIVDNYDMPEFTADITKFHFIKESGILDIFKVMQTKG